MKFHYVVLILVLVGPIFVSSCKSSAPNVPIYFYPPGSGGTPTPAPASTPTPNTDEQTVERNIVIDQKNNIFSIGIPAGWKEQTEVVAEKPIEFWFEYLSSDVKLLVNGREVQRNPATFETRIGYTRNATKFDYQISNTTISSISYNLHMIPSDLSQSVHAVVRQKWIP
jgi:hypothetical protein